MSLSSSPILRVKLISDHFKQVKSEKIQENTRKKLVEFYSPLYEKFENHFGARFSWMKDQ